jgi:diketogulonate reductase-like aldo/keto reductase
LPPAALPQVEELLAFARVKPVVNQVELHPHLAQRKLVGVCYRKGVTCVAYAPLGSHRSQELVSDAGVGELAQQLGKTPAQVGQAAAALRILHG